MGKFLLKGRLLLSRKKTQTYLLSGLKRGLLCMKGPDSIKLAGEDENNAVCCHCHFLWIVKDWYVGWSWRVIDTTVYFVPRAGVMTASTHLSSPGLSAWASLIWLLLCSSPQQRLISPILMRVVFDISTQYPCQGQLWRRGLWGHGLGHKMEKKQRHRVAAKKLVISQIWHVTLSPRVAQSAATAQSCGFSQTHDLKHQKCLSPDGKRQRSLLCLGKRNLRGLCVLSSGMAEGICWTWFLARICLTKALVCASKLGSHFRCPQNLKGFTSCFWAVVGTVSSLYRSLICGDFSPKGYSYVAW